MDGDGFVIIGGGAAAHAAARALLDAGADAPVILLSADSRLPYFRPHLSKELLTGAVDEAGIGLDDAWYATSPVETVLGCTVVSIDVAERRLGTDHGPFGYRRLLVATGSAAARLPVPGGDHPSAMSIRSLADAERVLDAVNDGQPFVVIGSGFVGCEAAASLRSRNVAVTMVSDEPLPQANRLGSTAGQLINGWLNDLGVDVRLGHRASEIIWRDVDDLSVVLDDGTRVDAAHLLIATGARPNVELLDSWGPDSRAGVPVDATMQTAVADVFAAGDVARAVNASAGRTLRVEHWGDAEAMGTVAGHVMAGHHDEWRAVPGFWSSIGGRRLKHIAWGDGWDELVVRPSTDGLTVWYGNAGKIVGVLTWNHDEDAELASALILRGAPLPPVGG